MDIEFEHKDLEEREYISADVIFTTQKMSYDKFKPFITEIKLKKQKTIIKINNGKKSKRKLFK